MWSYCKTIKINLQSQMLKKLDQNDDIKKNNDDSVVPGTICAIAASSKSNSLSE